MLDRKTESLTKGYSIESWYMACDGRKQSSRYSQGAGLDQMSSVIRMNNMKWFITCPHIKVGQGNPSRAELVT